MDRQIIDSTSGGALIDKTPTVVRLLLENMTSNNEQFGTRSKSITLPRGVHEINTSHVADHTKLESKLDDLAALVKQLAMTQASICKCADRSHFTSKLKEFQYCLPNVVLYHLSPKR